MGDETFDDPTLSRPAIMTSGNWASELVNECEAKKNKK